MISIAGTARILLYDSPVDMRKGFEGLGALVEQTFQDDLVSGAYIVFLNRSRNRMKVIYWDADGLAIWPDALRGEDNVHARARSEVEDHIARAHAGERERVAAAECGLGHAFGKRSKLLLRVAEGVQGRVWCRTAAATRRRRVGSAA